MPAQPPTPNPQPPLRVLSLLPSATEILHAVGGIDLLVGRSHECDWPAAVASVPALTTQRTGGTTTGAASLHTLEVERLRELRPDVILTQDLCSECSIDLATVRSVARTMSPEPLVVSLDPKSIEDVLDDVLRVGEAIGRPNEAEAAVVALRERYWTAVDHVNPYVDGPSVALLESMDPLLVAGHWTPQLIEAAGGRHTLNPPGASSRSISVEELVEAMPQRLIVCPCGYDLEAIDGEIDTLRESDWWALLPAVRDGQVVAVDGSQMFNRPGPRLVDAFRWLVSWINGVDDLAGEGFPAKAIDSH